MNERAAFARDSEDRAVRYLEDLGWRILRRNVMGPGGELDIVALDGRAIVFVEVKARASRRFGSAAGAVDRRKRARMRAVASDFLQVAAPNARARFDVITIEGGELRHIRNAFM